MTAASSALPPSPLPDERKALLDRLVDGLDTAALWWLSGYAAGLAQGQPPRSLAVLPGGQAQVHAIAKDAQRLTVVYGSQTGNARREAEHLAAEAESAGLSVRLLRADAYPTRELASERLLYVVISTQGEGDPPDDAIGLVEFLTSRRAPKLPELKYAVLGLGDSSYADFCGIARRIDERLAELGGSRVQPRGEADLDIDSIAAPWRAQALKHAREQIKSSLHSATVTPLRSNPATPVWSHQQPFAAELLSTQIISGRDFKGPGFRVYAVPDKRVRHLEFSLQGSGLSYEPGDALGIRHRNPPALVDAVLQTLQLDGDAAVTVGEETLALTAWLATQRELTKLSRPFLTAHAERAGAQELQALLAPTQTAGLASLLADHQVIDVLRRWPADWDHAGLLAALRPLTPRLYSIASSRKRVGDEVHLTVDEVTYQAHGHAHLGSASGFLAALAEGDTAPVYIEPNERFRVPADSDRDILMIGPGTGVAPFRGFVQERAETGATGRNWLFFGAQHFNTDFLYQAEWQLALQRGELHALEVAFSRDQAEKLYVQHRLRARGAEVYAWLQGGAHVYVCGATGMGKDVHAALLDIVATHGVLEAEAASAYLTQLQVEGRYARDVY
ncbi:assimilatory sulfite reductase (NADPH) flavoprotein subunit [Xanthomonas prunicola]|uniref:assimilatory sulfite reductase (NADPH) flavoprotein subunit n=1 Tax=Xanthomonas prunicola TaxID=2053930 RepID=UPI0021B33044|nr:assimilatory sulfite reductase (NADPH) flavoprotein subunit [Xanthomonas prunicola]UXA68080.1 assimilatory sulfite reductase (NADPH) flavoprotein subunit [Xanthomonas prunicola]